MKTLVFKLKNLTQENKDYIKEIQKNWSTSFRMLYNNLDLVVDKNYLKTLPIKPVKMIEYLTTEVIAFDEKQKASKDKVKANIDELLNKNKMTLRDFRRLQKNIKSFDRKVVFGGRENLIKRSKGKITNEEWQELRLYPIVFYGDKSSKGNRNFDSTKISEGLITFKYEGKKVKLEIYAKKCIEDLVKLQHLSINKEIPITYKLTHNEIHITFDERKLNGTFLDIKAFYPEIKHVKDKEARKALIYQRYLKHDEDLKGDRLDRYMALDLNPDGIGYCVRDKQLNIITKGFLDISSITDANKRRYETSILLKRIFILIKHFRCFAIVVEELELKNTNLGNKVSNRKVNNLWNRTLISEIINRKCNEQGIKLIEINPAYSSFIGNIVYNEYDPVAASLEICRRGITKYTKGSSIFPELNITNLINDEMYEVVKGCDTWTEVYKLLSTSNKSVRRGLKKVKSIGYNISSFKSGITYYAFPYNTIF